MTPKRSLPTVSLDDIFKKEPCWIAQMGPVAAAKKMTEMVPEGAVSLRTLNRLVMTGWINAAEADWVDEKTGLSRDYDGPKGNGYWGANLAKHLDNWENPKLRTIHDLPVGTQFTFKRRMDMAPRRWVVLPRAAEVRNQTQIMALEDGTVDSFTCTMSMAAADIFTDVVEPGNKPTKAPKPVIQKSFGELKTGDCFKSGDEVFLRISGMSTGMVAAVLTGDRKGIAVLRGSAVHDTLLKAPVALLPDFIPSQTPT